MACYLLSEDYMSLKGTILELLNTMGSKSLEQLVHDYNIPSFRPLDMEIVRANYDEYKEALLQIFHEANYKNMIDSYGRWHYPEQATWNQTMSPPVRPDDVFGLQRARM